MTGFRIEAVEQTGDGRGAGGRGRPPALIRRRPGGGADRVPAGSVVPVGDAAGPGSGAAGAACGWPPRSTRTCTPAAASAPHGAAELAQPEPGLYLVGMKSYGRAPTFLALTGYEQVRSVVAELTGDHEAAARVELTLPDTGVCGGAGLFDDPEEPSSGGCCGPAPRRRLAEPQLVTIGSCSAGRAGAGHPVTDCRRDRACHAVGAGLASGAGDAVRHRDDQLGNPVLRLPGAVRGRSAPTPAGRRPA